MSAPFTSTSSSPLISFTQDVNYSGTEGFKQYKTIFNQKNTQCARNDPCGSYPTVLEVYTTTKSSGMLQQEMGSLSLQDFITSGSLAACRHLKRLSLAPYYTAQMKRCMQKWDKCDNQGAGTEVVNTCRQLISVVSTGLYHSIADVQMMVSCGCGPTYDNHQLMTSDRLKTLGVRGPETSDYMLRTLRALVE